MSIETIAERVLMLIPVWLSLTVHEFAHAWSAFKLGDNTAHEKGRLTLNPIAHIDPVGTLLLPLFGVPFGWARPVPVNPMRFNRRFTMRQGMLITAAAGPISNLLLALASTVLLGVLLRFAPGLITPNAPTTSLFLILINVNVALALFNLLPIYPLDGSRIADGVMPDRFRPQWDAFCRYAPLVLIAFFIFGAGFLIEKPAQFVLAGLSRLMVGIAGY